MVLGDRLLGVLDVQSEVSGRFTEDDIHIKTALADQIAVAVQNAQLYQGEVESARQLREVDRLKSEFLASMSHELRTPLNSIIGYSEVLADGIDGDLPDEALEDVNAIHDSGNHLLSLINDILDLAKIEAGRMELERQPIALSEVVTEVDRITRSLIKEKPVQLVYDVPNDLPLLSADHVRLRQILNNLVSNAIKFTDHGDILISAKVTDDQKLIEVAVQDSGIGIAPEHQNLVFEQFRQVDSGSTRKAGGTGLGLPITQHLVRMHGGEIWLTSTVGTGSTFFFTIPVVPVAVTDS
jgi:signal transduction histidine kinase